MFVRIHRWLILPDFKVRFQCCWEDMLNHAISEPSRLLGSRILTADGSNELLVQFHFTSKSDATTWERTNRATTFFRKWNENRIGEPQDFWFGSSMGTDSQDEDSDHTMERIRNVIAEHFGISINKIMSNSRPKDVAFVRHLIMWFCKKFTPRGYPEIGRFLGGKDPTTVRHGHKRISEILRANEQVPHTGENLGEVVDLLKVKLGIPQN